MNNQQIIDLFSHYNPMMFNTNLEWFNVITSLLCDGDTNVKCHNTRVCSALVDWKFNPSDVKPKTYNNVVAVSMISLYPTTLMSIDGDFTHSQFRQRYQQLLSTRAYCKQQSVEHGINYDDVIVGIKMYINLIFGQLNQGMLRHERGSMDDVVSKARECIQVIYSHPKSFYVDTDTVWIEDTVESAQQWMTKYINGELFPYLIERYESITITGKKKVVIVR